MPLFYICDPGSSNHDRRRHFSVFLETQLKCSGLVRSAAPSLVQDVCSSARKCDVRNLECGVDHHGHVRCRRRIIVRSDVKDHAIALDVNTIHGVIARRDRVDARTREKRQHILNLRVDRSFLPKTQKGVDREYENENANRHRHKDFNERYSALKTGAKSGWGKDYFMHGIKLVTSI